VEGNPDLGPAQGHHLLNRTQGHSPSIGSALNRALSIPNPALSTRHFPRLFRIADGGFCCMSYKDMLIFSWDEF
jgi:hypothetical protein